MKSNLSKLELNKVNNVHVVYEVVDEILDSDSLNIIIESQSKHKSICVYSYKSNRNESSEDYIHVSIYSKNDEIPTYGNLFILRNSYATDIVSIEWLSHSCVRIWVKNKSVKEFMNNFYRIEEPLTHEELINELTIEISVVL